MDCRPPKVTKTIKEYLTTAASVAASAAATAIVVRTIVNELLPNELRSLLSTDNLFKCFSTEHTIIIRREPLNTNELYEAARTYLHSKISPTIKRLKASKSKDSNKFILFLCDGEELIDIFQGTEYKWKFISQQESQSSSRSNKGSNQVCWFELMFHKKYYDLTCISYIPHILEQSKDLTAAKTSLKLHMNNYDWWGSTELSLPTTFDTLAMEPELKRIIIEDLERFVKRKEYYKRIGKAWKRGYLLFGPPGTGKSSLIAAISNYLNLDIYDLDLATVSSNSDLKLLLVGVENKSMLVIEDIDCSINLRKDEEKPRKGETTSDVDDVTLSGLLNILDGLWSTSGEERIIVFTTNYKEKLDPTLLQPGRMDMHIYMGYCSPSSFKLLAFNYHNINDHPLFEEIEALLKKVEVTPAQVAEELIRSDDVDIALNNTFQLLLRKSKE